MAGPLSSENALPAWFIRAFWVPLALIPLLSFVAYRSCLKTRLIAPFIARLLAVTGAHTGIAIVLGILAHRDYFTAAFQSLMTVPAVFFLWYWTDGAALRRGTARKGVSALPLILAAFYTQWIFLMGYAIATRAEPRPIEAIFYNLYNLALVFSLVFSSWKIDLLGTKEVLCGERTLLVDGRDLSETAGKKKMELLHRFTEDQERKLTCAKINRARGECGIVQGLGCDPETAKATACLQYRLTYNQILELKKFLESLGLGSITSPEHRRNVLREGWSLIPFEGVRFKTHKNSMLDGSSEPPS